MSHKLWFMWWHMLFFNILIRKPIIFTHGQFNILIRRLAIQVRSRRFPDSEKLKKLKFSRYYLRRLARYQGIMFTTRRSNQVKKTEEELKELRKPIDDFLEIVILHWFQWKNEVFKTFKPHQFWITLSNFSKSLHKKVCINS